MATRTYIAGDFDTRLASQINVGGTSGALISNVDADNHAIPDGYYFFTIDGGNALKEYIYCLLTTNVALGITTYDLTNIYSVSVQGVQTVGTVRVHRYSATVEITNFANLFLANNLISGADSLDGTHPLIYDSVATINDDKKIGTKAYADSLSITTPLAKASATVQGRAKMSVAPADAAVPLGLGTNDPKIPTQAENDAMAGTGTPSGANKYVTADNSARLNNVDLSTDQSVDGIKTLTSIPILPASSPTTDNQMVRKAYADSILS